MRGRGYLRGVQDLGKIVVKSDKGTPVLLKDVARIELGPDERRGLADLDGKGEVAGAITLQRFGSNALDVIDAVKARLAELVGSLPEGTRIVPVYDRSRLILSAIGTLEHTLFEESAIVAIVCIVFLLHVRSALVAILMLPVGILMALGAMRLMGLGANIMSLGGIAIAIGAMIDGAVVMIENAHKHLERAAPASNRREVLVGAAKEVGPALFFSLLVITVSFTPIFTLESQEGRLFGPLAFTKTFSMAAAAILSITLVPVLMVFFIRGRIVAEHRNPVNRALIWLYRPIIRVVLRHKPVTLLLAATILAASVIPARQLGSEFMPNLDEGTLLYMPTTLPGISLTKAGELLQTQDRIIKTFPEVASVYGKAGRADTATDPAHGPYGDVRDDRQPEAQGRMAGGHDDREPAGRDGQGAAVPGRLERLDHADQGAHRHARHRHPHPGRHQGAGPGPRADGGCRAPHRGGGAQGARHHQRLRRARARRLLPRDLARPRRPRALRPDDRRPAGHDRHGAGRRGRSPPPSKAASATRSTSATRARCAAIRRRSPATCS